MRQGLGWTMAKERDEDLALFHEMQRREREKKNLIRPARDSMEAHVASRLASASLYRMTTSGAAYRTKMGDDLLYSDVGKNDYDWLLTPPGTPLLTASETSPAAEAGYLSQKNLPLVRSLAALKTSRLANGADSCTSRSDPAFKVCRGNVLSRPGGSSLSCSSASAQSRRSSLAPSSTPSSRSSSRPNSRATTPTGRPSIPSSVASSKTSTYPSTRSGVSSRPLTPSRRPTTPVLSQTQSQPACAISRSSSVSKAISLPSRSTPSSRGSSPTTRPRPWQPSAMPGFSLEPPPNLRTTMPERSTSNSRGASVGARTGGPTSSGRATQVETADINSRSKRQSRSPSVTRGRQTSDRPTSASLTTRYAKGHSAPGEATGPIILGSKMVEKVLQARRAAASSALDETTQGPNAQPMRLVKPTSPTIRDVSKKSSKKTFDPGLRLTDARQSTSNGLRPIISNATTHSSSLYGHKSVVTVRGRPSLVGDSPMATSSNASSEHSMSIVRDFDGSDAELISEWGSKASPASQSDSLYSFSKDVKGNGCTGSPDYRDDSVELMQLFRQGIEKFAGSESPLVCQHGRAASCEFCNMESRVQNPKSNHLSNNIRSSLQNAEFWKGRPYSDSRNGMSAPSRH